MNFKKFTKEVIDNYRADNYCYKKFDINDIKRTIKEYKYIDVTEYYYDSPEDEDLNTWIDIEGMGYGWLWCHNWFTRKFRWIQRRQIRNVAYMSLENFELGNKYLDLIDLVDIRHLIFWDDEYKIAIEIRLDNERMSWI